MKNSYLKIFFLWAVIAPLCFYPKENHQVGERSAQFKAEITEASSQYTFSLYPEVRYLPSIHSIKAISILGDTIDIEDDSQWKINSFDAAKTRYWKVADSIIITQNHRWFSKYKYKLVNQATGSLVEANLHVGPLKKGEHTRYIIGVDITRDEVILNDGTHWKVSSYDKQKFDEWKINDAIIIGYNSSWDSDCQAILINVPLNEMIRAEQF